MTWEPSASIHHLKKRAHMMAQLREFFSQRGVWEVETPLLSHGTVTDPYVVGIPAFFLPHGATDPQTYYLQTSPEYAMKRLLAAGSGSIYQICKAFRQGDVGDVHNPEFTILEWYRLGFDHHALMDEMDEFLQLMLATEPADRISYEHIFLQHLKINPHQATLVELAACAHQHNILVESEVHQRDTWLDLLWTHALEPVIAQQKPLFLYDFPSSQACLAKIRPGTPPLASRFEVYFKGVELANGFHELQDAAEQKQRFATDLNYRKQLNLPPLTMDANFLAALNHGLPDCSGVAVGIDRIIMLALQVEKIKEVISFDFARA